MKLTGPTCDRLLNEVEKDGTQERKPGRAGWVRVERGVRRLVGTIFQSQVILR